MKKIYQIPEIKVVRIHTMQMLAESININGNYGDGSGISTSGRYDDSDWDDDEY